MKSLKAKKTSESYLKVSLNFMTVQSSWTAYENFDFILAEMLQPASNVDPKLEFRLGEFKSSTFLPKC